MIVTTVGSVLVQAPIELRIQNSVEISEEQKRSFLNLLSYLTPGEIRELESLL